MKGEKAMPGEHTPLVPERKVPMTTLLVLIVPALLANCVEFYDYAAYTSLAPEISDNMYATDDNIGREFGVWVPFSFGQAARPVGGVIFGYIGDKYGRRPAIIGSTLGMVLCTSLIGIIPTLYCCGDTAGMAGLVILWLLRMVQGVCAAGELSSSMAYVIESAPTHQVGLLLGVLLMSGGAGFLIASGFASLLESTMEHEQLLLWGWRLPFVCALPLGLLLVWYQFSMRESEDFEVAKKKGSGPVLKELWGKHKLPMLLACGITAAHAAWHYGTVTFLKDFLVTAGVRDVQAAGLASMVVITTSLAGELLSGLLYDRIGFVRGLRYWVLGALLLIYPLWVMIVAPESETSMYLGCVLAGLYYGGHVCIFGVAMSIFPPEVRTSGFGFAYNAAQLIFAAPAPYISEAIWEAVHPQHGSSWAANTTPAIWTAASTAVTGAAYLGLRWAVQTGAMPVLSYIRPEVL